MNKLKSHKTVEQIAKKHRMDVSDIQKQLDMGEPIEHEHTQDHDLAKDIALQHLDEFPDYYTRLKKMEATAKKEHKKFKDVVEGNLRDWFGKSKSKDGKSGWVNVVTGGTCASDEPGEGTPKCVSSSKRASMTDAERKSAARRKKAADPGQQSKSDAAKPTYVSTDSPKKMNEESDKKGKGSGTKDACYTKVKSRYSVWPSAYASGALVKCRKVGAANWGNKTESYPTIAERILGEEKCGKGMYWCNTDEVCKPIPNGFKTPGQKTKPTEVGIGKPVESGEKCNHTKKGKSCPVHSKEECPMSEAKEKDQEYSMARSELSTIANATKRLQKKMKGEGNIEAWVQSKITKAADYLDSAADYVDSGEMNVGEEKSFTIGNTKKLTRSQQKLHSMTPKQRAQLPDEMVKKLTGSVDLPPVNLNKEETLVDKLTNEILDEKCWSGYKKKGMKTMFGKKYPNCVKEEDVTIEDAEGNTFAEVIDLIKPEPIKGFKSQIEEVTRLQAQTGNVIAITLSWRAKYYSLKMFFPQVKLPTRKEITDELQKVYPGSNVIYHTVSEIQPGQPLIQAFGPQGGSIAKPGPSKKYVKPYGEQVEVAEAGDYWHPDPEKDRKLGGPGPNKRAREDRAAASKPKEDPKKLRPGESYMDYAKRQTNEETAAWQRKEGKNPEGGLNKKGIASYRRENPGSKLSMAVTTPPSQLDPDSKSAKRRKSFCARMGGMAGPMKDEKGRPTRKALSLKKWNC